MDGRRYYVLQDGFGFRALRAFKLGWAQGPIPTAF